MSGSGGGAATWAEVFSVLARRYGWTFDQIADMSMDQIEIAVEGLADPEEGGAASRAAAPGRIIIDSDEDLAKYPITEKRMVPVRSAEELERVLAGDRSV